VPFPALVPSSVSTTPADTVRRSLRMPSPSEKPRPSLKAILLSGLSVNQVYVLACAVLVLSVARVFYGSLKMQTEHVDLWFHPDKVWAIFEGLNPPRWSAPLDDVFIHFDFARASARGYPLEWIEGNGYSSGGTSLLYPFLLALGFVAGNLGLDLMHWAGILACVGTFATLLGAKRMFHGLPEWTSLLAPVAMLSVGALNWTLFSGMEVAIFLAFWALSFVLWDDLANACESGQRARKRALLLGLACALLVASRPEAAPIVAVYGVWSGYMLFQKSKSLRSALVNVLLVGVPGAVILLGQMFLNKALTGDSAAAGALAKLEMHHPYLTSSQVVDSWVFFLKYQFLRLSNHHFSAYPGVGYLVWPLALVTLLFKQTRRTGIVVWLSIIVWFCLVALNGQVRWQNERYTMPAVAWLLLLAALGMGATFAWALSEGRALWARYTALLVPVSMAVVFAFGQAPRYRDQVWFFGRAARNILEQHVRAGSYLADPEKNVKRVLLSDAGAIPYVSDLPAFDLIGLGGYGRLPIARASRQGVGAALELFRYVPPGDLPDVMALYPSWWDDFVLWFGVRVHEFPVRGNVICGGASKVIYAPRWAPLLHSDEPLTLMGSERLIDSLDIADVISEEAHEFSWDRPAQGYVDMKLLPDLRNPKRDLWDAGRLLSTNMSFSFQLSGFSSKKPVLLIRVAPAQEARLELSISGAPVGIISVVPADHWQELRVDLPQVRSTEHFSLRAVEGALHLYHLFAVEPVQASE
jgi:hypothetical protein